MSIADRDEQLAGYGVCKAGRVVFLRVPDGTWPTAETACTEPASMVWTMVTPGAEARYEFRAELCGWHAIEMRAHFHHHDEPPPWRETCG